MKKKERDIQLQGFLNEISNDEIVKNTIFSIINIFDKDFTDQQKKDKMVDLIKKNVSEWNYSE